MKILEGLTFDDVLLQPAESVFLPSETNTSTRLTSTIDLGIPLMSSAMATVTEHALAISMAQAGGLGVIHKNLDIDRQAEEVRRVKRFEAGMVVNPITIGPNQTLADAHELMDYHNISGIPVTENKNGKLVGILTHRDVRFASDPEQPVAELMTEKLVTVSEGVDHLQAKKLLHENRIEKLLVVDRQGCCVGLITVKDIEKAQQYPDACKDEHGRLRVAGAIGVGDDGLARAEALLNAGCDVVVIDTAHGHSAGVLRAVEKVKQLSNSAQVLAGNVATADGAKALIDSGADAVKIGIGPGSICTTRIVAGVGVPQLSAIMAAAEVARKQNIPVVADGGIKFSGDLPKAIAAGADCAMLGSLFAGTDETPGKLIKKNGKLFKSFRGMGSVGAMNKGSADRYFQSKQKDNSKYVPEGVEGLAKYKGKVDKVIFKLVGGLRSSMGYLGSKQIKYLRKKPQFIKITKAGFYESMVHNVDIVKDENRY